MNTGTTISVIIVGCAIGCGERQCDLSNDVEVGGLTALDDNTFEMRLFDREGVAVDAVVVDGTRVASLQSGGSAVWRVELTDAQVEADAQPLAVEIRSACGVWMNADPIDFESAKEGDLVPAPALSWEMARVLTRIDADATLVVLGPEAAEITVTAASEWLSTAAVAGPASVATLTLEDGDGDGTFEGEVVVRGAPAGSHLITATSDGTTLSAVVDVAGRPRVVFDEDQVGSTETATASVEAGTGTVLASCDAVVFGGPATATANGVDLVADGNEGTVAGLQTTAVVVTAGDPASDGVMAISCADELGQVGVGSVQIVP